jgi:hypothetical protein
MLADRAQVVFIPLARHFVRRITHRPLVYRIEVQLEVLVHFLAVIFWVARETPRFEPIVADVVRNARIDLVMGLIRWFARPFLDVFGIWPFGCVTVCDRCHPSEKAIVVDIYYSPVQVMPKSIPTMKSGCHPSLAMILD